MLLNVITVLQFEFRGFARTAPCVSVVLKIDQGLRSSGH